MSNLPIFLDPCPLGFWFYVGGHEIIALSYIRALKAVLVTASILHSLVTVTCVYLSSLGVLRRLGCWELSRPSRGGRRDRLNVLGSGTGSIRRVRGLIRIIPVDQGQTA